MTRIILESENKKDLFLITELAERLKIKYRIESSPSDVEKEKLEEVLSKGADISNYGDPVSWQRKVRKDRRVI